MENKNYTGMNILKQTSKLNHNISILSPPPPPHHNNANNNNFNY